MKKLFFILLIFPIIGYSQVTTLPNSIGIGQNTLSTIPLHINKPGEVARFQGASPYVTFYDALNFKGYIQAIGDHLEIGSKNNHNIDFFTNNLPQFRIDGTSGQITAFQKINANNGIRLSGPLQAQGESVGAVGMVLVSKGNATPAWENQKVGFEATFPFGNFTLLHNAFSTPVSFLEYWDYDNNFTPSTGIFVVPSSGLYHFDWSFGITLPNGDPAVNQGKCRVALSLGGGTPFGFNYYDYKATMSSTSASISGFKTIKLNQGDSIQFSIYQSNENNRDAIILTNGSSADPIFHAYKIF
jgi:hypothetical protein